MTMANQPSTLLNNDWEPFTETIWFIEAPYAAVVAEVRRWRDRLSELTRYEELLGALDVTLAHLEPWAMPSWKELLVATRGGWTALFSQGSDVSTFDVVCRSLRCRAVRTNYAPHVVRGCKIVSYGDTALRLSDGARDDLGPLYGVRNIQATYQGRWEWHLQGELQPFEEPELYTSRIVRKRFDLTALNRYCSALGIDRSNSDYYGPEATLVTQDTSAWPSTGRRMTREQWNKENR